MADGRKNNGGARKGAGRPSKAEEFGLAELIEEIIPKRTVLEKLKPLVDEGNLKAIELCMYYHWGKPRETVNQTTNQRITIEDNTENGLP